MSTKQQRLEFASKAIEAGWPDDRIDSVLYCNIAYDTPLPHESWTQEMLEGHLDRTLETYLRDEHERLRCGTTVSYRPNDSLFYKAYCVLCYCAGFAVGFVSTFLFGSNRQSI